MSTKMKKCLLLSNSQNMLGPITKADRVSRTLSSTIRKLTAPPKQIKEHIEKKYSSIPLDNGAVYRGEHRIYETDRLGILCGFDMDVEKLYLQENIDYLLAQVRIFISNWHKLKWKLDHPLIILPCTKHIFIFGVVQPLATDFCTLLIKPFYAFEKI